ncbi:MAG: Ig-like domain-containing protein [Longibaculum muris]|nr:Ig-like domain-containing protein [Longibaculum muris]MED9810493.1 Ig-like domain-containing protein [Longibaculum muris]
MKTKCQKIWGLVLSLLLVVPLITMNPVKAENVSHKVFELSAPEKASVGHTIDVDLRMYPKDKFAAFDLYINFDEEALKYKSAKLGMGSLGISVEYNQVAPGKLKVAVAKGDEFESNIDDSILITFKMEVLNTKEAVGTHGIQLEVYKSTDVNGGKLDFVNEIKNTQITIDAPLKQISLNKKSLVMDKGNTETLVVSKIPEFTTNTDVVQWSSEDSEIASVDQNGKITAHKGGKTTIKAAIGEFAATCEVTVTIPLESLSIDKLDSAIDVGSKQQLVVKYLPLDTTVNKKVTWKSLDTTIATVDENGIVTGVKRGTATIQATMAGMSTTVEVKVKQPLVGIKIDQSDFTLIKNKEKALTVSEDPSVHDDVIDQKVWSSSDEKIATVD